MKTKRKMTVVFPSYTSPLVYDQGVMRYADLEWLDHLLLVWLFILAVRSALYCAARMCRFLWRRKHLIPWICWMCYRLLFFFCIKRRWSLIHKGKQSIEGYVGKRKNHTNSRERDKGRGGRGSRACSFFSVLWHRSPKNGKLPRCAASDQLYLSALPSSNAAVPSSSSSPSPARAVAAPSPALPHSPSAFSRRIQKKNREEKTRTKTKNAKQQQEEESKKKKKNSTACCSFPTSFSSLFSSMIFSSLYLAPCRIVGGYAFRQYPWPWLGPRKKMAMGWRSLLQYTILLLLLFISWQRVEYFFFPSPVYASSSASWMAACAAVSSSAICSSDDARTDWCYPRKPSQRILSPLHPPPSSVLSYMHRIILWKQRWNFLFPPDPCERLGFLFPPSAVVGAPSPSFQRAGSSSSSSWKGEEDPLGEVLYPIYNDVIRAAKAIEEEETEVSVLRLRRKSHQHEAPDESSSVEATRTKTNGEQSSSYWGRRMTMFRPKTLNGLSSTALEVDVPHQREKTTSSSNPMRGEKTVKKRKRKLVQTRNRGAGGGGGSKNGSVGGKERQTKRWWWWWSSSWTSQLEEGDFYTSLHSPATATQYELLPDLVLEWHRSHTPPARPFSSFVPLSSSFSSLPSPTPVPRQGLSLLFHPVSPGPARGHDGRTVKPKEKEEKGRKEMWKEEGMMKNWSTSVGWRQWWGKVLFRIFSYITLGFFCIASLFSLIPPSVFLFSSSVSFPFLVYTLCFAALAALVAGYSTRSRLVILVFLLWCAPYGWEHVLLPSKDTGKWIQTEDNDFSSTCLPHYASESGGGRGEESAIYSSLPYPSALRTLPSSSSTSSLNLFSGTFFSFIFAPPFRSSSFLTLRITPVKNIFLLSSPFPFFSTSSAPSTLIGNQTNENISHRYDLQGEENAVSSCSENFHQHHHPLLHSLSSCPLLASSPSSLLQDEDRSFFFFSSIKEQEEVRDPWSPWRSFSPYSHLKIEYPSSSYSSSSSCTLHPSHWYWDSSMEVRKRRGGRREKTSENDAHQETGTGGVKCFSTSTRVVPPPQRHIPHQYIYITHDEVYLEVKEREEREDLGRMKWEKCGSLPLEEEEGEGQGGDWEKRQYKVDGGSMGDPSFSAFERNFSIPHHEKEKVEEVDSRNNIHRGKANRTFSSSLLVDLLSRYFFHFFFSMDPFSSSSPLLSFASNPTTATVASNTSFTSTSSFIPFYPISHRYYMIEGKHSRLSLRGRREEANHNHIEEEKKGEVGRGKPCPTSNLSSFSCENVQDVSTESEESIMNGSSSFFSPLPEPPPLPLVADHLFFFPQDYPLFPSLEAFSSSSSSLLFNFLQWIRTSASYLSSLIFSSLFTKPSTSIPLSLSSSTSWFVLMEDESSIHCMVGSMVGASHLLRKMGGEKVHHEGEKEVQMEESETFDHRRERLTRAAIQSSCLFFASFLPPPPLAAGASFLSSSRMAAARISAFSLPKKIGVALCSLLSSSFTYYQRLGWGRCAAPSFSSLYPQKHDPQQHDPVREESWSSTFHPSSSSSSNRFTSPSLAIAGGVIRIKFFALESVFYLWEKNEMETLRDPVAFPENTNTSIKEGNEKGERMWMMEVKVGKTPSSSPSQSPSTESKDSDTTNNNSIPIIILECVELQTIIRDKLEKEAEAAAAEAARVSTAPSLETIVALVNTSGGGRERLSPPNHPHPRTSHTSSSSTSFDDVSFHVYTLREAHTHPAPSSFSSSTSRNNLRMRRRFIRYVLHTLPQLIRCGSEIQDDEDEDNSHNLSFPSTGRRPTSAWATRFSLLHYFSDQRRRWRRVAEGMQLLSPPFSPPPSPPPSVSSPPKRTVQTVGGHQKVEPEKDVQEHWRMVASLERNDAIDRSKECMRVPDMAVGLHTEAGEKTTTESNASFVAFPLNHVPEDHRAIVSWRKWLAESLEVERPLLSRDAARFPASAEVQEEYSSLFWALDKRRQRNQEDSGEEDGVPRDHSCVFHFISSRKYSIATGSGRKHKKAGAPVYPMRVLREEELAEEEEDVEEEEEEEDMFRYMMYFLQYMRACYEHCFTYMKGHVLSLLFEFIKRLTVCLSMGMMDGGGRRSEEYYSYCYYTDEGGHPSPPPTSQSKNPVVHHSDSYFDDYEHDASHGEPDVGKDICYGSGETLKNMEVRRDGGNLSSLASFCHSRALPSDPTSLVLFYLLQGSADLNSSHSYSRTAPGDDVGEEEYIEAFLSSSSRNASAASAAALQLGIGLHYLGRSFYHAVGALVSFVYSSVLSHLRLFLRHCPPAVLVSLTRQVLAPLCSAPHSAFHLLVTALKRVFCVMMFPACRFMYRFLLPTLISRGWQLERWYCAKYQREGSLWNQVVVTFIQTIWLGSTLYYNASDDRKKKPLPSAASLLSPFSLAVVGEKGENPSFPLVGEGVEAEETGSGRRMRRPSILVKAESEDSEGCSPSSSPPPPCSSSFLQNTEVEMLLEGISFPSTPRSEISQRTETASSLVYRDEEKKKKGQTPPLEKQKQQGRGQENKAAGMTRNLPHTSSSSSFTRSQQSPQERQSRIWWFFLFQRKSAPSSSPPPLERKRKNRQVTGIEKVGQTTKKKKILSWANPFHILMFLYRPSLLFSRLRHRLVSSSVFSSDSSLRIYVNLLWEYLAAHAKWLLILAAIRMFLFIFHDSFWLAMLYSFIPSSFFFSVIQCVYRVLLLMVFPFISSRTAAQLLHRISLDYNKKGTMSPDSPSPHPPPPHNTVMTRTARTGRRRNSRSPRPSRQHKWIFSAVNVGYPVKYITFPASLLLLFRIPSGTIGRESDASKGKEEKKNEQKASKGHTPPISSLTPPVPPSSLLAVVCGRIRFICDTLWNYTVHFVLFFSCAASLPCVCVMKKVSLAFGWGRRCMIHHARKKFIEKFRPSIVMTPFRRVLAWSAVFRLTVALLVVRLHLSVCLGMINASCMMFFYTFLYEGGRQAGLALLVWKVWYPLFLME